MRQETIKSFFGNGGFRWHRFSRAKYAVFASMGKEFTIGVLSVSMLASVDLKSQVQSDSLAFSDFSDNPAKDLDEIEVTAVRIPLPLAQAPRMVTVMTSSDINAAAVCSVNDLLKHATGVDVRQRGEMGVQTDISVRGGTFDQITILLNGINISSPQTGHHSADFPVSMDQIERIEVLEGPAARVFGTSAFCGAINIVTKNNNPNQISAHVYGGSYGLVGGEASASVNTRKVWQQISGGYVRADGDQPNSDFKKLRFFYQGGFRGDAIDLDWQTGVCNQDFGANTFYSAAYPNQWESITRWITSVKAETHGRVHFSPVAYWQRSKDHFQLVRNDRMGENYHRMDIYGLNLCGWVGYKIGKTAFGAECRSENILSTNIGKETSDSLQVRNVEGVYYNKKDSRTNISYFVEQNFILPKWTISLGAIAFTSTYSNKKMKVHPGIDICFKPTNEWKITASWNMAMRLPTFTDLYYKSPTQEGNVGLSPEETLAADISVRYRRTGVDVSLCGFYHHGKNMLDWVMYNADDVYHSVGFELNNSGFEVNAAFLGQEVLGEKFPIRKLSVGYAHIWQNRNDEVPVFKSCYALEYLRHKLVASLDIRIIKSLNASLNVRFHDRNGSYIKYDNDHKNTGLLVPYDPYAIVDMRLSWDKPNWCVYVEANNLFNVEYYDHGNIPQPGIWVRGGGKYTFSFKKRDSYKTN